MSYVKRLLKRLRWQVPVYIPVMQSEQLKGRTALITGGTRGLGYAIAEAFLHAGCRVIIAGRDEKSLESARERLIQTTGCTAESVLVCVFDLMDTAVMQDTVSALYEKNIIDILVNNAGVADKASFGSMTVPEYDLVMDTNLKGAYFLTQIIANNMIAKGVKGNILNIGSSSCMRPATLPYTISKWGIRGFTEGMAKLLIKHGIVVNGIAPGQTATAMLGREDDLNSLRSPIGRLITPVEIANMAVILVSDMGKSVVGDIVYMTGGSGVITYDDIDY